MSFEYLYHIVKDEKRSSSTMVSTICIAICPRSWSVGPGKGRGGCRWHGPAREARVALLLQEQCVSVCGNVYQVSGAVLL